MSENELIDQIDIRIKSLANNNPAPTRCIITQIYDDGRVDITINDETLSYVEKIGTATVGETGIVLFLDGDFNNPFVIVWKRIMMIFVKGVFTVELAIENIVRIWVLVDALLMSIRIIMYLNFKIWSW